MMHRNIESAGGGEYSTGVAGLAGRLTGRVTGLLIVGAGPSVTVVMLTSACALSCASQKAEKLIPRRSERNFLIADRLNIEGRIADVSKQYDNSYIQ